MTPEMIGSSIGLGIMVMIFAFLFTMALGDSEPEWKKCKTCHTYYMKFMEGPNGKCPYVHSENEQGAEDDEI